MEQPCPTAVDVNTAELPSTPCLIIQDQLENMNHTGGDELTSSTNHSAGAYQTKNDSLNNCEQLDTSANIFFIILYSLVFLVAFVLNGFIIKFYFCGAQQQTSSSIVVYLKNLVVADFLWCLCLPIRIINFAINSITIRRIHCYFNASVFFLNMYASILFMAYIAANRYLKIVSGTGRTHILQTVRAARIISTVTWILLMVTMSTYMITAYSTQKPLTSVPVFCDVLQNDQLGLLFEIIHSCSTIVFLLILVFMLFCYYSTSRRVSIARQSQPMLSSSKKLKNARRKMLVLVCVFCLCFVPYHLIRVPRVFLWRHCSWKAFYYLMELTIFMSVLNVCLDPLIYFIFCKSLRAQFSRRVVERI